MRGLDPRIHPSGQEPEDRLFSKKMDRRVKPGDDARRAKPALSVLADWVMGLGKQAEIEAALRRLAPKIPAYEFGAVIDHALHSEGLRQAGPEAAAWLSLVAFVRHVLTEYDDLLEEGYDAASARFFVAADISAALTEWGVRRRLTQDD